ncbi:MAG TPA: NADPH-dependent FMN reductase [Acidimicrobiia bacterium]|jgi:NAD(P)H-dependent FMN reductase
MRILGISGSLNPASSNTALLQLIARAVAPPDDMTLAAPIDDIPHFSPERDTEPVPPGVSALRAAIGAVDVVVIATPEYAGGMPGSLKNALDWLVGSGDLYGKSVVILSAAPSQERGAGARDWVERTVGMQGARVCDSFTVAVPRGGSDDELPARAEHVLTRLLEVVTTGPCAGVA